MSKPWKAFFRFKEPTISDRNSPLNDLEETWVILKRQGSGAWYRMRSIPASSPRGGGVHTLEFEGLVGNFEVELISVDRVGMQSPKEWLILAFGDTPPGKPEIGELGTAYPYD